jgi:hypothetical protein
MSNEYIRLGARDPGDLAMSDFCELDFWLKRQLNGKMPFDSFPGIFSSLDLWMKKVVDDYFAANEAAPEWLGPISDCVACESPAWLELIDEHRGIRLRGQPDHYYYRANGDLLLVDYKLSRYTKGQDHLLPLYNVQLNMYRYMRAKRNLPVPKALYLIYLEPPDHKVEDTKPARTKKGPCFWLTSKIVEVEIKPEKYITGLLDEAARIARLKKPPKGRDGCENCRRLSALASCLDRAIDPTDSITLEMMCLDLWENRRSMQDVLASMRHI